MIENPIEWERWYFGYAFQRVVAVGHRRSKFQADCGHWVDGSEPYCYSVWRTNDMPRGVISQRTSCEFCARENNAY